MHSRRFPTSREAIDRGCLSLFLVAIILVIYRHFWLAHGRWLDDKGHNWQPPGCMMHSYNAKDVTICLQSRKLIFIGDSAIRQIFSATAKKLGVQEQGHEKHSSFSIGTKGVTLEFVWDPYINSSSLHGELTAASFSRGKASTSGATTALLIGGGLWHARYIDEANFLEQFKYSVDSISQHMNVQYAKNAGEAFDSHGSGPFDDESTLVLLAPVSIPAYSSLSQERAKTITPTKVDAMNLYLQKQSLIGNVTVLWSFSSMTALGAPFYQSDGLHPDEIVASRMADVLLNTRCNTVLREASAKGYPMDKTCCNNYKRPNWIQAIFLNASVLLSPIFMLIASHRYSKRLAFFPSRKISNAITVLALAVCYCYYADRTQLFNKAQKQYRSTDFTFLCTVACALGILSIRRSGTGSLQKVPSLSSLKEADQGFMSRHQTDEWKGWMQFIILIYHYTGASNVLWVYQIIRILVASYLFLTGFGHAIFFYRKADYSLRRCAAVLIRLNMLSCILPYVMETDYLFYYFAPLISFWYMIIYVTMAFRRSNNDDLEFLVRKIVISATLINILIRTQGIFETLFYWLEKTCNIHWDVAEWRFRLQLDSFIVYVGMVCGILSVHIIDALRKDPNEYRVIGRLPLINHFRQGLKAFRILCVIFAVVCPLVYILLARKASNKYAYNFWVPITSTFPILSFVVLRNVSRHTRNFHCSIFAWMGQQSLETFTLQFHIWLAADTKGLLALGIFERVIGAEHGRKADLVLLTIIFLWICWHVATATQTLTNWIIDPREGREDVVADENTDGETGSLPRMRSNPDLNNDYSRPHVANGVSAGAMRSANRMKELVAGDLRVRLATIVGLLWLLNITYK